MENIFNLCADVLSKAIGDLCMFCVSMATGTTSLSFIYEPEMPAVLRPQGEETER